MGLAGAALLVPDPAFGALCWPLQLLAELLIALVHWISSWPGAQLLTGHPPLAVVLMVSLESPDLHTESSWHGMIDDKSDHDDDRSRAYV